MTSPLLHNSNLIIRIAFVSQCDGPLYTSQLKLKSILELPGSGDWGLALVLLIAVPPLLMRRFIGLNLNPSERWLSFWVQRGSGGEGASLMMLLW
jgi:hypothetical protein